MDVLGKQDGVLNIPVKVAQDTQKRYSAFFGFQRFWVHRRMDNRVPAHLLHTWTTKK